MENACTVFENICLGLDSVFRLTASGNCQYEVATCVELDM